MKYLALVLLLLGSMQVQAGACKCTCGTLDNSLCASSYDLDSPCNGTCKIQGMGISPLRTACQVHQVYNPDTGLKEWYAQCIDN